MASVSNAKGVPLYYSGSSTKYFSATNSGPQLFGTIYNDSMWGDANVTVTMFGGAGDDIYYLYSSRNKVVEYLNQGIDTINTWMSYTLPTNVENLIVTGDKRYRVWQYAEQYHHRRLRPADAGRPQGQRCSQGWGRGRHLRGDGR